MDKALAHDLLALCKEEQESLVELYGNPELAARGWRHRRPWWLLAAALVAWTGSWRVMYLEVTRWHHMDARLRFTPPPAPPGAPLPRAGLPVILARAVAVVAPPAAVAAALLVRAAARSPREDNLMSAERAHG